MISKRDTLYLNVAKAAANLSPHVKCRVGAVVIKAGEIISVGWNILKSHPMQMRYNVHRGMKGFHAHQHHLHAEIATLLKVKDKTKLKGASIYIARVKRKGETGLARPCPACYNFIKNETPIVDCYYTTETQGESVYEQL